MEQLPMAGLACSLSEPEFERQLGRYRAVGEHAEVIETTSRHLTIQVGPAVPLATIQQLIKTEQECCPFFELVWDESNRCLGISVDASEHKQALDAIAYALGMTDVRQ